MQYALVSSTCKTSRRNVTLAVERDIKQQINLNKSHINVSEDENLTRLLDSFHRDRPKRQRGIPSWNFSLVLHQLTKAPFEPTKEASLKHLTFKTFIFGPRLR